MLYNVDKIDRNFRNLHMLMDECCERVVSPGIFGQLMVPRFLSFEKITHLFGCTPFLFKILKTENYRNVSNEGFS